MSKLPLGVIPRRMHEADRYIKLKEAIQQYVAHNKEVPIEWIEEYNELSDKYKGCFIAFR